jgi:hypothetical protein
VTVKTRRKAAKCTKVGGTVLDLTSLNGTSGITKVTEMSFVDESEDTTIDGTAEELVEVGALEKASETSTWEITLNAHGDIKNDASAGSADCSFQIRVDGKDAAGLEGGTFQSSSGGSTTIGAGANLKTDANHSAPLTATAIFAGLAAGEHTISIWVRGVSASECGINDGNYSQKVIVKEYETTSS